MTDDTRTALAEGFRRGAEKLKGKKYLLLILAAGLILLMWPSGKAEKGETATPDRGEIAFDLEKQEEKLSAVLSSVSGAGRVKVLLTLKTGTERVVAVDTERSESDTEDGAELDASQKTVVVSAGSSTDDAVTLKYIYPEYLGAVIVAEGADSGAVRLALTEAASAATGLGTSKIKVIKMK